VPSPSLTALAAAVLHIPDSPERVLEIDCGSGDGVLFLAREYPTARLRGLDPSPQAIRQAVGRIGLDPEGRVAFKCGRSRSLPYPDGFFDLIAQADRSLHPAELARALRPGGHLVLVGEWRWLDWRLEKHCFVIAERGEAEGERFHVFRLDAGEPPPQ
jgi:ubiquinone/menaquinone biosynthesis C-methylase UbiE